MRELEQAREQQGDETAPYSGFSLARRRVIIGLVSTAGFFGPLAGGIYLPALPVLQNEFGVDGIAINATVAVFMAVCAFAGLFWSSFADWKGRRPLYIIALAIYLVANVLMGTLPANFGALVFLRMVQAFGCSSVMTLGGGTVADVRISHPLFLFIVRLVRSQLWTDHRARQESHSDVCLPHGAEPWADAGARPGRHHHGTGFMEMVVPCSR